MSTLETNERVWLQARARGKTLNLGSGRSPVLGPGVVNIDADPAKAPWMLDVLADAQRLPFAAGAFDVVLSAHLLEILAEPRSMLCEATRVLRPGGSMWHIIPAADVTGVQNRPHHPFAHWRRWWLWPVQFEDEFGTMLRGLFTRVNIGTSEHRADTFTVMCEGKR